MAGRRKTDVGVVPPGTSVDEPERLAIREDLDTTILVEAAAGTGKTSMLVDRMVALVSTGKTTVDRLSAVTFTIRAAAQLRQRFQNALEESLRAETNSGRRGRLAAALNSLDLCFTGTIHAFAARLLRERPIDAGIEPGFTEMDEPENGAAREQAWDRFAERLFVHADPRLARLIELRIRLDDLSDSFAEICENSDINPAVEPRAAEPDFSLVRAKVDEFLQHAAATLPEAVPPGGFDPFQEGLRRALRLSDLLDLSRAPDFVELLRVLRGTTNARGGLGALKKQLERLREEVIKPALARWAEYIYPDVLSLLIEARDEFAAWRRRNGRANFQDLLLEARNLLRDRPSVRSALFERFTPILVDEFQDTDPIQAEILFYLTGADREEEDWKRLVPAPGSLFVVGDPKQSIYRFRRADIQIYQEVRRVIERCGKVLRLSTNFRSTPGMCEWINRTFARPAFFPDAATPLQPEYVPLAASKPDVGAGGVFRIESPSAGNSDLPVVEADSVAIADSVAAEIAAGRRRPDDFLILFRRRRYMPNYARALESRGVAVHLGAGSAFGDSEDLRVLLPLLRALADPDNPVPLVAALRGPVFGIDDDALYRFARAGGRFQFRSALPDSTDPRLGRAFELFREGEELLRTLPPAAAIARFVRRLGLAALAAAQPLAQSRAGTLAKAVAAARKLSGDGMDFLGVLDALEELCRQDLIEQMSIEPGRSGAVRLLTIHAAKGLEAPWVILAEPCREPPVGRNVFIDRAASPPIGHFRIARWIGERGDEEIARPVGWDAMQECEKEFDEAEKIRLLYVASTRAEEALAVSVKRSRSSGAGGPWAKLDPYLPQELPRLPPSPPLKATVAGTAAGEELEAFRALAARRRDESGRPAYSVTSVTSAAHRHGDGPVRESTGRGMAWGRVLHGLLEAAMRDSTLDLRAFAANLLADEGRPSAEIDEALGLVEAVRSSALWRRALASSQCLVEVPFALAEPGESEPPRLWTGAIDLVFLEKDRWILVDYKSDTVSDNRSDLIAFYRPQLEHYRRFWEKLTGTPTTAGIYFIQTREEVWLD